MLSRIYNLHQDHTEFITRLKTVRSILKILDQRLFVLNRSNNLLKKDLFIKLYNLQS